MFYLLLPEEAGIKSDKEKIAIETDPKKREKLEKKLSDSEKKLELRKISIFDFNNTIENFPLLLKEVIDNYQDF